MLVAVRAVFVVVPGPAITSPPTMVLLGLSVLFAGPAKVVVIVRAEVVVVIVATAVVVTVNCQRRSYDCIGVIVVGAAVAFWLLQLKL